MQDDPSTARPDRMAEAYGAAIYIQPLLIERAQSRCQTQFITAIGFILPGLKASQDLGGKRLIDLPIIDILELEPMTAKQRGGRMYRTEAHLAWVQTRPFAVEDPPKDRQLIPLDRCLARQDQTGCPIGHLGTVAGRYLSAFPIEGGLEFRQGAHIGIWPDTIVLIISMALPVIYDLDLAEPALLLSRRKPFMAAHRKAIHGLAADVKAMRQHLCGLAH